MRLNLVKPAELQSTRIVLLPESVSYIGKVLHVGKKLLHRANFNRYASGI